MANILIFDPNSTPIPNIPTQYLESQNTMSFIGRNDVLFNPIFPDGWALNSGKVEDGQCVFFSQSDLNLISGTLETGIATSLANRISGSKDSAKKMFYETGLSSINNAFYAFNKLVFKSINNLRSFIGLDTFSNSQLLGAIEKEIDGLPVYTSDEGKTSRFNKPFSLQFVSTIVTWTNMPLADTFFGNSVGHTQYIDLTNFTGVQLCITKGSTAGNVGSMLQLRYNGNFNTIVDNYLPLDTNNTMSYIDVTNSWICSGYQPIVSAAKSGVFVTLVGGSGNGVIDPQIGNVVAYFQ